MPGVTTVVGLLLFVFVPSVYALGIAIFLGGLSATIIAFLIAAVSD